MKTRMRRTVGDQSSTVAKAVGHRIRQARRAAGLTQRELAGERYTSAYVSMLETGHAKPSVAALHYLAERLGTDARALLADDAGPAIRAMVDLRLAAGEYQAAADGYRTLLNAPAPSRERPRLLLGLVEALCRMDQGRDAVALASEAQDRFAAAGRPTEAAVAAYWLAAAQFQLDNSAESKALLGQILSDIRAGLAVSSDFRMRVLVALAMNETADGEHEHALAYLEEARGLESEMDDVRRARYLYSLAVGYQEVGDLEAALRAGGQAAALFRAAESDREIAAVENLTAMIYNDLGNVDRANSALARAQELAGALPGDERFAASMADTHARILLSQHRAADAEQAARSAVDLARRAGVLRTAVAALLTLSRALEDQGLHADALEALEESAATARERGGKTLLRRALAAYANALAKRGRHEEASALYEEALSL